MRKITKSNCENHISDEKMWELYFSGELTEFYHCDSDVYFGDYGYEWCDKCEKWKEEEGGGE